MSWPLPLRLLVAAVSGSVLSLAFAPYGLWWLLPVAVAGLTLACTGVGAARGALVGLLGGLGFFLTLLDWIQVIGTDAWLGLALLQALFWAGLGAGLAVVAGLPGWPLWATGVWVLVEALRSVVPWGGFPWGRLAHALVDSPLLGFVHLGGVTLLSAIGATVGTLLAGLVLALLDRDVRRSAGAVAIVAALVGIGVVAGVVVSPPPVVGTAVAAIVQGNVPRLGLDFLGQREAVLTNHLEATGALADDVRAGLVPKPDLVLWPENSSDIDPFNDPSVQARIDAAVADVGAPTLVGVLVGTPDGEQVENVAIVWDPVTGAGERYVKRHPVPFGEYIPGRALLTPIIGRLDRIPRDMRAGDAPGVLTLGPTEAGVVICFEIAYDAEVRDTVTTGAQMLVVQTNNATYGRTGQPNQQFDISRLRAVEHGRDVLIASTSGISAVIRADGTVEQVTEEFTQEVLVDTVDLRDDLAWATRSGAVVSWLLAGLGVAGIIGGAAARRRVMRRGEPA
ncbi:MAG: apolipoprotein N-acyltransferase [Jiangellales bacterium]